VRDEQLHREKSSSPLFFDHGNSATATATNVAFSGLLLYYTSLRKLRERASISTISKFSNLGKVRKSRFKSKGTFIC
jgi:hypothetical protein